MENITRLKQKREEKEALKNQQEGQTEVANTTGILWAKIPKGEGWDKSEFLEFRESEGLVRILTIIRNIGQNSYGSGQKLSVVL